MLEFHYARLDTLVILILALALSNAVASGFTDSPVTGVAGYVGIMYMNLRYVYVIIAMMKNHRRVDISYRPLIEILFLIIDLCFTASTWRYGDAVTRTVAAILLVMDVWTKFTGYKIINLLLARNNEVNALEEAYNNLSDEDRTNAENAFRALGMYQNPENPTSHANPADLRGSIVSNDLRGSIDSEIPESRTAPVPQGYQTVSDDYIVQVTVDKNSPPAFYEDQST